MPKSKNKITQEESTVEAKLKEVVELYGGECLKFESPTKNGVPDRLCFMPGGRTIQVELKDHGGRLSAKQKKYSKDMAKIGHTVHIVTGLDGVETFREGVLEPWRKKLNYTITKSTRPTRLLKSPV